MRAIAVEGRIRSGGRSSPLQAGGRGHRRNGTPNPKVSTAPQVRGRMAEGCNPGATRGGFTGLVERGSGVRNQAVAGGDERARGGGDCGNPIGSGPVR
jgi:hypothetical protein